MYWLVLVKLNPARRTMLRKVTNSMHVRRYIDIILVKYNMYSHWKNKSGSKDQTK